MSDTLIDPELEDRIRRAMHAIAEEHRPAVVTAPPPAEEPSRRRALLVAAAALLLLAGVGALFAVASRDTDREPAATEPTSIDEPDGTSIDEPDGTSTPDTSAPDPTAVDDTTPADSAPTRPDSSTPNAAGDVEIDPAALRFGNPLPDDVVAFLDDPSLPAPTLADASVDGPGGVPTDNVRFVALDGARQLMIGTVTDLEDDSVLVVGDVVEIGVPGARYIDDAGSAIAYTVGDRTRLVAATEFVANGGSGQPVEAQILVEVAAAIGANPLDELGNIPGIHPTAGTVGGQTLRRPFDPTSIATVSHGDLGPLAVSTIRLAETPTALGFVGIATGITRGFDETPAIGDVTLSGGATYVELVSPLDLVVVTARSAAELERLVPQLDVAAQDDLAAAFDGSVDAPPAPTGIAIGEPAGVTGTIAVLDPTPDGPVDLVRLDNRSERWVSGIDDVNTVVELDGDRYLSSWTVFDRSLPWDASRYDGPVFDAVAGVEARFTDASRNVLAIETPAGTRLVTERDLNGDPTRLVGAIGADPVDRASLGPDLVLFPTATEQFGLSYRATDDFVFTYLRPEGSAERVASVVLGSLIGRGAADADGDVFVASMDGGARAVLAPLPDGRVAVIATTAQDPVALAESLVVVPIDDVEFDTGPVEPLDTLVARAENADGHRFELRSGSSGDDTCWSLDVGSLVPAADTSSIFGGSAGVSTCTPPHEVGVGPFHLCVGSVFESGTVLSKSGVVEGAPTVMAQIGAAALPVEVVAVDGWTFFRVEVGGVDTTEPITMWFDGQLGTC